ncbi:leucine dehydrogenase [Fusobacteria bacterium ZRK30]|nr:leucine dehydrogenase [Fusobacteria bacterium ZRK30]
MKIFDYMEKFGHEQLVFFHDKATKLKGITGIHDTTLGPALGGTRLWNYATEDEATEDVLRLSRGMTYKAACAGLNLGGGKTVLIGDPKKVKSEAYFRGLGRFVQSLNGRYITAEDVNTSTKDMLFLSMETDHVVGLPGKSGNPSPVTAWGVFAGLKATLKETFGSDSVADKTFAVQGAGQTGYFLIKYLLGYDFLTDTYTEEKAKKIYFTEVNEEHIARMKAEHPEVEFVAPDDIYGLDVDLFAPCALGGVINDETISQFKCKAIAGSSNNVLKEDSHADVLREKGIVYAPDYVINAAGLINVYYEIKGYNRVNALHDSELIYDRLLDIYKISKEQGISTHAAASHYAEYRIEIIKNIHRTYIKR